jgi:hypothetical protein
MCQATFAQKDGENEVVRLSAARSYEREPPLAPLFTPFVAAGFFIGPAATVLVLAPFDPYLPFVFMGEGALLYSALLYSALLYSALLYSALLHPEELLLSMRLWTHGNDLFSPTSSVVGHTYGGARQGQPKFWESLARQYR